MGSTCPLILVAAVANPSLSAADSGLSGTGRSFDAQAVG